MIHSLQNCYFENSKCQNFDIGKISMYFKYHIDLYSMNILTKFHNLII